MLIYYIKEAITGIFRAKLASFLTIIILSAAILFSAVTAGLFVYSARIEDKIKENVKIRLFLDKSLDETGINNAQLAVENLGYSSEVELITKEEAAEKLIAETGNNFIDILGDNPLPATLVVTLRGDAVKTSDFSRIVNYYTEVQGVESADYDYTMSVRLIHYLSSAKKVVIGVAIFLVVLAVYLTYLTNRLINQSKEDQFNTMKLVGANISTIKVPLYLRGFFLGILASGVIAVLLFVLYSIRLGIGINYHPSGNEMKLLVLLVFCCGILFGTGGSILAARGINYRINLK